MLRFYDSGTGAFNLAHAFCLHRLFRGSGAGFWELLEPGFFLSSQWNPKLDDAFVQAFMKDLPAGWSSIFTLDDQHFLVNWNQTRSYSTAIDARKGCNHFLTPNTSDGRLVDKSAELVLRLREESLLLLIQSSELPVGKRLQLGEADRARFES